MEDIMHLLHNNPLEEGPSKGDNGFYKRCLLIKSDHNKASQELNYETLGTVNQFKNFELTSSSAKQWYSYASLRNSKRRRSRRTKSQSWRSRDPFSKAGSGHEAEIEELGLQRLVEADEQDDRRVGERDTCRGCGGLRLGIVLRREEEALGLGRVVVVAFRVGEKVALRLRDIGVTSVEIDLCEELSRPVHHRMKVLPLFDSVQARSPRG
ncbi:hypothetical protein ACFX11_007095 [Malus domestica]